MTTEKPERASAGPAGASAAAAAATPPRTAERREGSPAEARTGRIARVALEGALADTFTRCCTRAADWAATLRVTRGRAGGTETVRQVGREASDAIAPRTPSSG